MRWAFFASLTAIIGASSVADAQLSDGGKLSFVAGQDFLVQDSDGTLKQAATDQVKWQYLNLAHCVCADAVDGTEQNVGFKVQLDSNTIEYDVPVDIFVGTTCTDNQQRPTTCDQQNSILDIDLLDTAPEVVSLPVDVVLDPLDQGCPGEELRRQVWMLVDEDRDATYEYSLIKEFESDTLAPPVPTGFTASGAEASIHIEWTLPSARADDIEWFQALCARSDGSAARQVAPYEPEYQTVRNLCGQPLEPALTAFDLPAGPDEGVDAGMGTPVSAPPPGIAEFDPAFVCGEAAGTARAMDIAGLENGVEYTVALIAIDRAGNPAGVFFNEMLTPRPAIDFWEDLHDRGGDAEGGFCLLASTYGDDSPITRSLRSFRDDTLAATPWGRWLSAAYYRHTSGAGAAVASSMALRIIAAIVLAPVVLLGLAWHVLTLPGLLAVIAGAWWLGRRHKQRRQLMRFRLRVATAMALLLGLAGSAQAQGFTPYWDEEASDSARERSAWQVGLKLGPYTPAIDEQFGTEPGPFYDMFRGGMWLPVVEIDWIFSSRYGQVGLGGSIGFAGDGAKAYMDGSAPGPDRPRATGDENKFRIVPTTATLVYRATQLDDRLRIPLVPYLRGGLAYYLWWFEAPSGEVARVYDPEGCALDTPPCEVNKARGGSLGLTGSIGLALRAERIDPDAAQSMRDSGIEHAGFYAELNIAWVDDFGRGNKLAVGDKTWFAGVNFEF